MTSDFHSGNVSSILAGSMCALFLMYAFVWSLVMLRLLSQHKRYRLQTRYLRIAELNYLCFHSSVGRAAASKSYQFLFPRSIGLFWVSVFLSSALIFFLLSFLLAETNGLSFSKVNLSPKNSRSSML